MSTAPTRETGGDAGEVSSAASVQAVPAPRVPSPTTDIDAGKIEVVDGKPVWKPTRQFLLAFGSLCIVALAISFDATSLSVALPIISTALGGTALEAFWSGTSFLLATTVLQPTTAALSHIFGRKYLIYITSVLFAVGSLVAGLAHNFTVILVGRSLQGVGGGSLLALIEIVITDLVPLAFRPTWFSLLSAVWSVGTVTGPLIGAGFAQKVTWRWIFYINLPIIGLGLVAVALFLKQAKIPGGILQKLRRFDWVGSALFTAASTGFLFGLTTGGVMYEWSSWRVLLPLIAGFLGVVVFGFWEMRYAAEPIIHRDIFVNRDMVITYVTTVMHGAILWSILYFLVLYYQAVKFYTPVVSAVAALPESLTVAPAAMLVGVVAGVTGRYRWAVHAGWVLATAGLGILMLLRPETTVAQWIFINIPVGLGTGMLFPAMTLTIQAACEPALNAEAAAFFSFLRTFGQSVGVAVSGVIFQNVFRQKLLAIPALAARADEYSRDATIVVGVIQNMAPSPERDALVGAFSDGLRIIWASLLAFSAFSLIISLGIKGYSLNQEHVTRQGLVVDEKEQKRREQEKKEDSV